MTFVTLTKEEFAHHISHAEERSFFQSLEMAELYAKRGYSPCFVGWRESDGVKVSALIYQQSMFGGSLLSLDSGPVVTDLSCLGYFYKGLAAYGKKVGALVVQVKPYDTYQTFDSHGKALGEDRPELITRLTELGYVHDGLYTGYVNGEGSWNYVKDLRGLTAASLNGSFSKKGKPLVKKAKSFGTKLRSLRREELHLFKAITASTSDRRQYNDKSLDYYQAFYDSFGDKAEFMIATINFQTYQDQLLAEKQELVQELTAIAQKLMAFPDSAKWKKRHQEVSQQLTSLDRRLEESLELVSRYHDQDVVMAGALFIYMPNESYYLFSGSYTEFNKFYAPALLQEHAMLTSIERGIPVYNFLGIAGQFDQTDGVLRFKQNFNGYVTRKTGNFRYYPQPTRYKLIQLIKKIIGR